MKEKSSKTLLRWLGVLLVSHLVANMLFSLIFFSIIVQMSRIIRTRATARCSFLALRYT